jgi:hypothetical protein
VVAFGGSCRAPGRERQDEITLNRYLRTRGEVFVARATRDDFPMSVRRELWERAHFYCSLCREHTAGPLHVAMGSARAGDAAHITAAAPGGPRYDPTLTSEQRRSAANGIWMCGTHARLIDRDVHRYTADDLRRMKAEHEAWVTSLIEGRHRQPDAMLEAALEAHAIHDIRALGFALREPGWSGHEALIGRLGVHSDERRYGARVGIEVLEALDGVVGRMRGAVAPWDRPITTLDVLAGVAGAVGEAVDRVLPIGSLVGPTPRRPSEPEVQLFGMAASLGGNMAYDGALYIWDLRVVEAGAELLWRLLRYGHLNHINAVQQDAERAFASALDAARRSVHWPHGSHAVAFLEFKRADAMSDPRGEPLPLPDEARAAIQQAHAEGRARAATTPS